MRFSWRQIIRVEFLIVLGVALLTALLFLQMGGRELLVSVTPVPTRSKPLSPTPAASPSGTALSTVTPNTSATSTPQPVVPTWEPPALLVTPPPEGKVYSLTPEAGDVGWVRENDSVANNFQDYNILAGIHEGLVSIGAIRFNLAVIPRGAPLVYADLTLTGLNDEYLGKSGAWQVDFLEWWMAQGWQQHNFLSLARADGVALLVDPKLASEELGVGVANTFVLSEGALDTLAARVYDDAVAFRVVGPDAGAENLFSWDAGYGARSRGRAPLLRVVTGPAPATPPPAPTRVYVVVTRIPIAENALTAVPLAATATAEATLTGTPTPLPPNYVTPIIVTNTPTPANAATATTIADESAALAFLYGTPTPLPADRVWTATATPLPTATLLPTATPRPTVTPLPTITPSPVYVVVTPMPAPRNLSTAVAIAKTATAYTQQFGTPTRAPANWRFVTPAIVTNTPVPANAATATFVTELATAEVYLYGTPVSLPSGAVLTVTPIPPLIAVRDEDLPKPTITPTPLPPSRGHSG